MSSRFDKMIKDFIDTIKENKKTIGPYDTVATVVRIDGDTAFVHIPGGIDETPVSKTVDCKVGDEIQIRVGGGRAWIVGNATAPPTDDTTAIKASGVATKFIADLVDGIFVHREGDQKNGVKITDVVDIIRDGFKSATYGEETIFYEPKSNNIAAKIGAFGLKIIKGIISLGNKTSADDITNAGTYIDANGNIATSNIKAHGGKIGNWNIDGGSLVSEEQYTDASGNTGILSIWLSAGGIRETFTYVDQGQTYTKTINIDTSGCDMVLKRNGTDVSRAFIDANELSKGHMYANGSIIADEGCNTLVKYKDYSVSGYPINKNEALEILLSNEGIYPYEPGYTPVAIAGITTSHSNTCVITEYKLNEDGNAMVKIRNVGTSDWADITVTIRIVFVFTNAN